MAHWRYGLAPPVRDPEAYGTDGLWLYRDVVIRGAVKIVHHAPRRRVYNYLPRDGGLPDWAYGVVVHSQRAVDKQRVIGEDVNVTCRIALVHVAVKSSQQVAAIIWGGKSLELLRTCREVALGKNAEYQAVCVAVADGQSAPERMIPTVEAQEEDLPRCISRRSWEADTVPSQK